MSASADAAPSLDQRLMGGILAETPAGKAWLEKYVHPTTTRSSAYAGIPDTSDNASVHLEYKIINEQPVNTGTALAPISKTIYFLPPSIMCQKFAFSIGAHGLAGQDPAQNVPTQSIDIKAFPMNAESIRFSYLGDTISQDGTGFNNNSFLYGAQFRPNVQIFTDTVLDTPRKNYGGNIAAFMAKYSTHKGYVDLHRLTKGFTTFEKMQHKNGVHIKEQPVQSVDDDGYEVVLKKPTPRLPSTGNAIQVISLGIIPTDGGSVLMRNTAKSRTLETRQGGYFVHTFSEPVQRYISLTRTYPGLGVPDSASSLVCFFELFDPIAEQWNIGAIASSIIATMNDFEWGDMTWGMLLHDYSASAGLPGVQPAPLRFKRTLGLEVQPASGSILQPLAINAPMFDELALRTASQMVHCMPNMMAEKYNLLGGLMGLAKAVMPNLLSSLSQSFPTTRAKPKKEREYTQLAIEDEIKMRPAAFSQAVTRPAKKAVEIVEEVVRRPRQTSVTPRAPAARPSRQRSRSASRSRTPSRTRAMWGNRRRSNSRGRYE